MTQQPNNLLAAFTELNISNSVITGSTDTVFDLPMIFKLFPIQAPVLKIQYNNRQRDSKGVVSDCKTFYNQITFGLDNKANVKLFTNGNYQISGVKNLADARLNLKLVMEALPAIKGKVEVCPDVIKKVLCYNGRVLLPNEDGTYRCGAVYKNGFFMMEGDVCVVSDFDDRLFVGTRHPTEKKKKLYNIDCECVGVVEYVMKRKNKNLCLKGAYFTKQSDTSFVIHDKYVNNIPIGEMKILVTGKIVEHRVLKKVILEYSACKENPQITKMNLANINCNTKFRPQGKAVVIDRELLCDYLSEAKVKYHYDPCKYPGVKFSYQNTKITIFRTGSVLFSGKDDIKTGILWVASLLNEHDFSKKIIDLAETKTGPEAKIETSGLSIWDIM